MSHELRTPFTSMRMFIDTLREERVSDPAERERCLTVVNQELGRLDGLVGELIELSKIESRGAALEQRPVADNGVGIPYIEQETIFDKCQRGAKAIESGSPGSGLGLAIVKAIVEAHRGRVDVRSQVDSGSRFRVVVPRCRAEPR